MKAYAGDEMDHTTGMRSAVYVFNVADLSNPVYTGTFGNGINSVTHNFIIHSGRLYQANYETGVRVYDIRASPVVEVAYFDTFPRKDRPRWNGAWGVYVMPTSGTVVVADQDRGLFVLSTAATEPSSQGSGCTNTWSSKKCIRKYSKGKCRKRRIQQRCPLVCNTCSSG